VADWDVDDCHKMHYAQLPDSNGLDINFTFPLMVGDDWRCMKSDTVQSVHFWFSSRGDQAFIINNIRVGIHADIPASPNEPGFEYSKPGALLWSDQFGPGEFTIREYSRGNQGWYSPSEGVYVPDDHEIVYQCNIWDIPEPFVQTEGTIYWLTISVESTSPLGWKTSLDNFNDDGVWSQFPPPLQWGELRYPPGHQLEDQSIDLAFVVTHKDSFYCTTNLTEIIFGSSPLVIAPASVLDFTAQTPVSMSLRKGPMVAAVDLLSADVRLHIGDLRPDGTSPLVVAGGNGRFDAYMWGAQLIGMSDFSVLWGRGRVDWAAQKVRLSMYLRVNAPGFPPMYAHASGLGRLEQPLIGAEGAADAGQTITLSPGAISLEMVSASAAENPPESEGYALYPCIPNPFNPATTIRYDVPAVGGLVTLKVYDARGSLVRTLVDGVETGGEKSVVWDGRNDGGSPVATGVYFYRLTAFGFDETRKMMLLK